MDLDNIIRRTAPEAESYSSELAEALGLSRVGTRLTLKDSQRARAKAAILELGRPATKEEIAIVVGVSPTRVSSILKDIESIARATKDTWGLAQWLDETYRSIPSAIGRRIEEHDGAVALSFLLTDIPDRFGVKESSVRAFAASAQFEIADGMVRMADHGNITYRPLEEVADRNVDGELCWEVMIEEHHLRGHSIVRFPRELARELGCGPNDNRLVPVVGGSDDAKVSVIWRLASTTGDAEVGRVRQILKHLGATAGDTVRVVILPEPSVRFELLDSPPAE